MIKAQKMSLFSHKHTLKQNIAMQTEDLRVVPIFTQTTKLSNHITKITQEV